MPTSHSSIEVVAALESYRTDMIDYINRTTDALIAKFTDQGTGPAIGVKIPTFEQAQDPRNKDGVNLTARGTEIIYRLFDDGAGYNRASKALGITQTAARNRKGLWEKLGGVSRTRIQLDIDE
ncbi:hypothetical protein GUK30_06375 [Rhizobium leguminosarum]|jgi:hypothetical protein|uniref:hypothetical protein n=1 Tax=Rhizobium ruizarguesonis TaxID=2081791 RepID=UPI0013C1EC6C|nr:hypothetical protein [Rhizobium ruizarguesonis]NEI19037.1 hypothetical protein [Rhizobium ruizarguesonis]